MGVPPPEAPAQAPSPTTADAVPTLPVGARLLIVGPANAASTRLQRALLARREATAAQRVNVNGTRASIADAVRAIAELDDPITGRPPAYQAWRSLVRSVHGSPADRAVLASSTLADLDTNAIARIGAELGAGRAHALIVLQPLAEVLPDRWLRAVEAGERATFETWLERALPQLELAELEGPHAAPSRWRHLRDDRLVARWVEALGAGHVTVVVTDSDSLPGLRAVERLTGLREGTLAADADPIDRPLTRPEAELIRAFNELATAEGLPPGLAARAIQFGAAPFLRTRAQPHSPGEAAVRLPAWSEARVRSIGAAMADGIATAGGTVVGDLGALVRTADRAPVERDSLAITPELAATAGIGVLLTAGLVRGASARIPCPLDAPASAMLDDDPYVPRPAIEALPLVRLTTPTVAAILAVRLVTDLATRLRGRLRHRSVPAVGGAADPLLLPVGARLVHIGPFKTGTTSLQAAFDAGREAASAQGVHYTGPTTQPTLPVLAVTGRTQTIYGAKPPSIRMWHGLVREVDLAREPRVVVSSEFFSDASAEAAARVVHDLGGERVHIAVTLRPLARILASQWQQMVQSGARTTYDDWLANLFDGTGQAQTFWRRHRHDELVARWAAVAGTTNVTVVAVDDRDHAMVVRAFERLTGLRPETLSIPPDRTNRSLTRAETEAVRSFNELAFEAGVPPPVTAKVMRYGAATYLKLRPPTSDEPRIETPAWALARAGDVAREMVDAIASSGVRVIGDLDALAATSPPMPVSAAEEPGRAPSASLALPPDAAARILVGVLLASGMARGVAPAPVPTDVASEAGSIAEPNPSLLSTSMRPESLATVQVGSVFVRRAQAAAGHPAWAVRRRLSFRRRMRSGEAG
jgi:hypothetical protein